MSGELFGRKIEVITNNRKFTYPELDIEFDIKSDSDSIPDESNISIYNLSENSIVEIKKGNGIVVNAGYGADIGTILDGVISNTELNINEVDREFKITAINVTSQFLNKTVNKSYGKYVRTTYIMQDLAYTLGLKFDILKVSKDVIYPRGYYAHGKLKDVITILASNCNSRFIVKSNSLVITPNQQGIEYAYSLDSKHGLINVEPIDESDTPYKYTVKSLFMHGIQPYTFLDLHGIKVNGRMLVGEVEHNANEDDFITECKVMPI